MGVGVLAALMVITPLSPRGEISFLLDRNKVAVIDNRLRVDNALYRGADEQGRPFSRSPRAKRCRNRARRASYA